ncbi:hypothetical protein ALC56_02637, partial [Trachymyrmex septentrionalis]
TAGVLFILARFYGADGGFNVLQRQHTLAHTHTHTHTHTHWRSPALAPSRAIVAALRHSSPLHCCRPFPAALSSFSSSTSLRSQPPTSNLYAFHPLKPLTPPDIKGNAN